MTAKVPEPEALKLANEYLVALDHDTLENPTNALALLIQGVKDGATERAAAEVSGLRATLKLVERALPAGPGSPSHRIRALRETLDGVLEALDLTEAYENGHDVVAAAKALARDVEEIAAGLDVARARLSKLAGIVAWAVKLTEQVGGEPDDWNCFPDPEIVEKLMSAVKELRDDGPRPGSTGEGASVSPSFLRTPHPSPEKGNP